MQSAVVVMRDMMHGWITRGYDGALPATASSSVREVTMNSTADSSMQRDPHPPPPCEFSDSRKEDGEMLAVAVCGTTVVWQQASVSDDRQYC